MKRMMDFILLGMLIILFAACGGSGSDSSDEGNNTTPTTTTVSSTSTSTSSTTSTSDTTTTTVSENEKATAIDISWVPTPNDKLCTHTQYLTATITLSDADGDTSVEWAWYDKADGGTYFLRASGSANVTEPNGIITTSLTQKFGYHHWIKLEVTADGEVTNYKEQQVL
jgi:ABC-type glycerol-3-phosphate transport system substrate-binding protein